MRRREFVALLGGATAWPTAARAQQTTMPVIGHVTAGSISTAPHFLTAMRQALGESGYVDGRDVIIESHGAEGRYERLPAIVAELVRRQVAVLVATPTPAAVAARAATSTIPIVFSATDDPVKVGLVDSLARPGGNATGVYFFFSDLAAKQLGLLRELMPAAERIGLLVNPDNANAERVTREVMAAASIIRAQIEVARASDSRAIDGAFAMLAHRKIDALLVGADPYFFARRLQLATLATRHALPSIYNAREVPEVGGLMSYGTSLKDVYRQIGAYTGRILKGAKPADLPVVQSIRFELVINLVTAKALGVEIPPSLLARADEVIE
jgi:putative ABC transport system substrate-binding protein